MGQSVSILGRLSPDQRESLAIWRIYRQLCGPRPPTSLLAKLIADTADREDVSRVDAGAYAAQRLDRQRRLLRGLLALAVAYRRTDMRMRITALLEALPAPDVQRRRWARRHVSVYRAA